ncbi:MULTISPECIES: helix-turn-helix transcriptional regulator [Methylorubrum]|uniref:helix-turn-helix transcriptional regulator n=1 Tax=Methylorubrum sp. Q1 TaxID=2562453 RepID=UPI001076AF84|nr:transcriptional regulator [Methylorubrum sp. Q1]TFZ56073.1 transcriptional regulator [Methylorubrum sp. Q1]
MQTSAARRVSLPPSLERDRLIDSGQAAALLGFSLTHFRRLYRAGKVPPPLRIGERKFGWKAGALTDWIAAQERG